MVKKKSQGTSVKQKSSDTKQADRDSGIDVIGKIPWGTHLCQFYQTKQDLIDILVPYFTKGLASNEYCMWITSEPLRVADAKNALKKTVKNLDDYLKKGQIEILDSTQWYTKNGVFNADRVLHGWVTRESKARTNGYNGLRLSGNTFWLEKKHWKDFTDYEEAVNNVIGRYHMLAICSYSLDKCNASEILDVVSNHQFALIKKENGWHIIESSEHKKTLEEYRKSEEKYRTLFETMTQGVVYQDADGRIISANPAAQKILGLTLDQMQGRTSVDPRWKATQPDGSPFPGEKHPAMVALRTGKPVYNTLMNIYNPTTNTCHWININAIPQFHPSDPKSYQVYTTFEDITEQKQKEYEIARLASFPEKTPTIIVELDVSGAVQYVNPTAQHLFPDLKTTGLNHTFLKKVTEYFIKTIQQQQNIPISLRVNVKDAWYLQTIFYVSEFQRIRIYSQDITQWKKTEDDLQQSEEKYRSIVENTSNVIMVTQPDGKVSYLSPSSTSLFGYTPEELMGTDPQIFHPDDVKKVHQAFTRALKGEKGSNLDYRILTKQGETKWISHSWAPVFLGNKLQSVVSVIEDITARKTTEEKIKNLNESLLHRSLELAMANKEMETFSYSVSHDLRAPLRSINGFSQALLEDYQDRLDTQGKEYLQRVCNATHQMEQLIDDMLRLSRLTRSEMNIGKVDLGKLATTVIGELKTAEPKRKITVIIQKNLTVDGDANLLKILLENLLGNAWKFTKKQPKPRIEFGKKRQGKDTVFYIKDNGAGFNMQYANKLFIPFQRLHNDADYPGSGIGLGIVSRIIQRHHGRIWADAVENKGATFLFTIGTTLSE
jgi:PAS domain S-box-containing protein